MEIFKVVKRMIKQAGCKHEFEKMNWLLGNRCLMYKCNKCGKIKIIKF